MFVINATVQDISLANVSREDLNVIAIVVVNVEATVEIAVTVAAIVEVIVVVATVVVIVAAGNSATARSATNATRWDILHASAKKMPTAVTDATVLVTFHVIAVSPLTIHVAMCATALDIWHAIALTKMTHAQACRATIATKVDISHETVRMARPSLATAVAKLAT